MAKAKKNNLAESIRQRFAAFGGVELKLPKRGPEREPPKFARACFINRLGSCNRLILIAQKRRSGIYETCSKYCVNGFFLDFLALQLSLFSTSH
jgi:hypothetical protein